MLQTELKLFVEQNPRLVTMKESASYPGLFVLKYARRVFYDNLWTDELENFRGTIVDADFNIVSRPFQKIYNWGVEANAPQLPGNTPVTAYRKVNGFMAAVVMHQGQLLVSTTGSTDSEHVRMAKHMMLTHQSWDKWHSALLSNEGWTFMFECVHPDDPHIVAEQPGMYFLGWRENTWTSVIDGYSDSALWHAFARDMLNCGMAQSHTTTVDQLVAQARLVQHEGYVAYTEDGTAFKIKSPYYLTLKWMARNPRTDKLLTPAFRKQIDEEYYDLLDHLRDNIVHYTALSEQDRLSYVRLFLTK